MVAASFGAEAVAPHLERTASEALATARSEQEADLARQLLVAARNAKFRRQVRG
jgi:hypothetical protein